MSASRSKQPVRLATEDGRRVDKVGKAKRLAAQPATEAARLRRALAKIREEAEKAHASAKRAEAVLEVSYRAACGDDRIVAVALARHALIECVTSHRFALLQRYCEMAEEGTLCA